MARVSLSDALPTADKLSQPQMSAINLPHPPESGSRTALRPRPVGSALDSAQRKPGPRNGRCSVRPAPRARARLLCPEPRSPPTPGRSSRLVLRRSDEPSSHPDRGPWRARGPRQNGSVMCATRPATVGRWRRRSRKSARGPSVRRSTHCRDSSYSPKNLAMALAGEVGELSRSSMAQRSGDCRRVGIGRTVARTASGEVADVFLYLVNLASALDLDLLDAATTKLRLRGTISDIEVEGPSVAARSTDRRLKRGDP